MIIKQQSSVNQPLIKVLNPCFTVYFVNFYNKTSHDFPRNTRQRSEKYQIDEFANRDMLVMSLSIQIYNPQRGHCKFDVILQIK